MQLEIRWLGRDGGEYQGRIALTDDGSGKFNGSGSLSTISGGSAWVENCPITLEREV